MTPEQIQHNQKQRYKRAKPPAKVKIRECCYCKRRLVRLRTITRTYEVLLVEKDFVTWIDKSGETRRDAILTWDHLKPKSKGGGRGSNLAAACRECNHKKADKEAIRLENGEVVLAQPEEALGGFWIVFSA